eukprot:gene11064-18671_t
MQSGLTRTLRTSAPRPLARRCVVRAVERKEYFDYKDMPPMPLTVHKITIPEMEYVIVDKSCEPKRMASLAIFYDLWKDKQYGSRLSRKSALTALCMYDQDDVAEAGANPGQYPNIDLLQKVYSEGMDVAFVVEEVQAPTN